ncbi:hypothetical protein HY449_04065 [Candidatus Pacearchaeota archaeon]|nr:hypothetical protein [Candidatus Pacearchaeota archaeon]
MGVIKSILTGFISLFLILSVSLLILFGGLSALLHPQIYEDALKENDFYGAINLSEFQGGTFVKMPDGGMEFLVNGLLENLLSYLRGDAEELNLTLQIDRENLKNFFKDKINEIPECAANESEYDESGNPLCKAAGKTDEQFLDEFLEKKNVTVLDRENVDLSKVFNIQNESISRIRGFVKIYQLALYGLMFLFAFLTVLIFILSLDSVHSGARIIGIDFFIAGIFVLPATFLIPGILTKTINSVNLPIAADIAGQIVLGVISRINNYAYIAIGIGAVLFVLSFALGKIGK